VTTSESDDKNKSELSSKLGNPAGRGGSDAEMAATVLYLAGPGGLFCNGEVIHPDVSRANAGEMMHILIMICREGVH